jgi:hypothetical protein
MGHESEATNRDYYLGSVQMLSCPDLQTSPKSEQKDLRAPLKTEPDREGD